MAVGPPGSAARRHCIHRDAAGGDVRLHSCHDIVHQRDAGVDLPRAGDRQTCGHTRRHRIKAQRRLQTPQCRSSRSHRQRNTVQDAAAYRAQDGRALTSERGKRKRCMGACQRLPHLTAGTPGCVTAASTAMEAMAVTVRSECATPTRTFKTGAAIAFCLSHNDRARAWRGQMGRMQRRRALEVATARPAPKRVCTLTRSSHSTIGATTRRTRATGKCGHHDMPQADRVTAQIASCVALTTIGGWAGAPIAAAQQRAAAANLQASRPPQNA